jgi:hypothetical protein
MIADIACFLLDCFLIAGTIKDFTLPHRFQVESTWSQVDLWTPGGLSLVKIHLESIWTPPGLQMDYVDCVDSTPPHAYDAEEVDSTWILVDSTCIRKNPFSKSVMAAKTPKLNSQPR